MRRDGRVHFGGEQAACDDILHRARREPTTAPIGDDGTAKRPGHRHRSAPFLERVERGLANRDEPVLVAFARAQHRGHNIAPGLDEAAHRVLMEHLRQALFGLRRAHRTGRVLRAECALAPSEISFYRKEAALDGCTARTASLESPFEGYAISGAPEAKVLSLPENSTLTRHAYELLEVRTRD